MDGLGGGEGVGADLSKLSMADKQELQQFMVNEGQKANIQSSMSTRIFYYPQVVTNYLPK